MPPIPFKPKGLRVPSSRLSRLARMGGMATGIAGGMLIDGAMTLAAGRRPSAADLLMTPANALRVTLQLGKMRGAAMKLGQLVSMGSGDFLPAQLADIFARLRADAQHMPPRQLEGVLVKHWDRDWRQLFVRFDDHPIAAASIGQVHRARTRDGRDVAIKIQYPGVRQSIDSDVDNLAALLRLSNLLPKSVDVAPLLIEAKNQLHEEADYVREGGYLQSFGALLAGDEDYAVPEYLAELSGPDILVMSFENGVAIESLVNSSQVDRDRIMTQLVALLLRELFEFKLMQTDPNFANYKHDPVRQKIVLLDFGATRALPLALVEQYRTLAKGALAGDNASVLASARDMDFFSPQTARNHFSEIEEMTSAVITMLKVDEPFDFGKTALFDDIREKGMAIAADRRNWHIPPTDTLFVQRKLGGVFLLLSLLKARIDVRSLLKQYV